MNTRPNAEEGSPSPAPRRPRGLLLWLGAFAALLLALPLFAPKPAPRTAYTRYVSPPLPDGTRFTFLYPADLAGGKCRRSPSGSSQDIYFFTPHFSPTLANVVANAVPLLRDTRRDESISAMALPFERGDGKVKQTEYIDLGCSRNKVLNLPHVVNYHCLWLYDARAQAKFCIIYRGGAHSGDYKAHDATVIQSFRILPPGTSAGPPSLP